MLGLWASVLLFLCFMWVLETQAHDVTMMQQDLCLQSHFLSWAMTCIPRGLPAGEIRLCGKPGSSESSGEAALLHRKKP